jgi:hypothetical protein
MDLKLINHDSTSIERNIKCFKDIDKFIHLPAHNKNELIFKKKLEWIPYNKFCNIKYITEGKFKKMYRANWVKECVESKRKSKNQGMMSVFLKSLDDSNNVTSESIINEVIKIIILGI